MGTDRLDILPTGEDILEHPLVTNLAIKPETDSHLVTLTGYPAVSADDDYFRLYLDRHFQSYYEIPRKHFVNQWQSDPHRRQSSTPRRHQGRGTPRLVVHVHKRVSSSAAALLQGPMVSAHLASAIDSGLIWTAPIPHSLHRRPRTVEWALYATTPKVPNRSNRPNGSPRSGATARC